MKNSEASMALLIVIVLTQARVYDLLWDIV